VADSVFQFTPPAGAKIEQVTLPSSHVKTQDPSTAAPDKPKLSTHGHGLSTIAVAETKAATETKGSSSPLEALPKVSINGTSASELRTQLGTLLTFERSGVRYLLGGSVPAGAIEAFARGL
jgi:hypothetical protein